jgi:hypothetical protein
MGKALGGGSSVGNDSGNMSSLSTRRPIRKSDILLALLTGIACISSIAHIFMHSHTLPSPSSSQQQQHPHHKNILKETLDNFVQQTKRRDISSDNNINKSNSNDQGDDDDGEEEEAVPDAATANDKTTNQDDNNSKPATIKQKVLSFLGKKEEETKTNNDNNENKEDKIHPVAHLNCADHGGPTDPHIIDEMVFWSDIPSDASYLSPMHPLNDPYTPDDTERYLTFEPDHGGWSKSLLYTYYSIMIYYYVNWIRNSMRNSTHQHPLCCIPFSL